MAYVSNSNAQRPDSGITRGENRNNPPIAVHYTNVVPAGSPGLNIPSKSLSEEHTASTEKGFEPRSKSNSIEPEPTSSDELFEEILTPGFDDFEFELIPRGDPALLNQVGPAEDHSGEFEPILPDESHAQGKPEDHSDEFEPISPDKSHAQGRPEDHSDEFEPIPQGNPALFDQVGPTEDHSDEFEPISPDESHAQGRPEDHSDEFELIPQGNPVLLDQVGPAEDHSDEFEPISRPWDGDPEFNPNDPNILEKTHWSNDEQDLLFFDPSILPSIPHSIRTQMFLEKNLSLVACCIESGDAMRGFEKINPTRETSYELRIRAARDFALMPVGEQSKILLNTLRLYLQVLNDVARFVANPGSFETDFGFMASRAFDTFRALPKEEQIRLIKDEKVTPKSTLLLLAD